jgi:hypothetical protein
VALLVLNLLISCNTDISSTSLKLNEWGDVAVVLVNLGMTKYLILFASVDPIDEKKSLIIQEGVILVGLREVTSLIAFQSSAGLSLLSLIRF